MPKKTETLYSTLLPLKVVTFNDIILISSQIIKRPINRRYIYQKYVKRLVETGKLQQIRKGLYVVLSPLEKPDAYEPDKLLIASKIRNQYYIGFHTALEFYGCAYSTFNEAYVCIQSRDRFDPFHYMKLSFKPVFVKDVNSQISQKTYLQTSLRVSNKERTFIECIDRIQYAGGWEECIKSLDSLNGIDFEKLINLTLDQKKENLSRRVGYILELLQKNSPFYEHLKQKTLDKLREQIKNQPQYLIRGKKGALNKSWNLYIPEDFEEKLGGI
jgi:predicted transcriptional regulator of viral defense system